MWAIYVFTLLAFVPYFVRTEDVDLWAIAEGDIDEGDILCKGVECKEDIECPESTDCQYGTISDMCNCCQLCAKGPGDHCGGMWYHAGGCGDGMICIPHPKYYQLPGRCAFGEHLQGKPPSPVKKSIPLMLMDYEDNGST